MSSSHTGSLHPQITSPLTHHREYSLVKLPENEFKWIIFPRFKLLSTLPAFSHPLFFEQFCDQHMLPCYQSQMIILIQSYSYLFGDTSEHLIKYISHCISLGPSWIGHPVWLSSTLVNKAIFWQAAPPCKYNVIFFC